MRADETTSRTGAGRESYARIVLNLAGVLGILAALALVQSGLLRPKPRPAAPADLPVATAEPIPVPKPEPAPEPEPEPEPPPAPKLDIKAVARAEASLAAARRDRERAVLRADDAGRALAAAELDDAAARIAGRSLPSKLRDPSSRINAARTRGGLLAGERDKLKGELATLANVPKAKPRPLLDKSPVAKPSDGEEYHFELRRNRVAYIDMNRLINLLKNDLQSRIRHDGVNGPLVGRVGPIGAFSMRYEVGRTMPESIEALVTRGPTLGLRGLEIVPEGELRGEPFEEALRPASDFARAIGRLSPSRSTLTLWVYPDGFALYRRLRDALHARGFTVAARPLPDGIPIRASPHGSISAGQ
ncbi:MAG TPA: hypothetical protein VG406_29870 [Isosphaeraceae bacterium]|jgi:hypothetical protein|nr:hypothetical protein [Isosphaeraceae bacterium]